MSPFEDFLRQFNNKDVVLLLKAMQKLIVFYQDINIDMLKLGPTLPNPAKVCLHRSTDTEFLPSWIQIKTC